MGIIKQLSNHYLTPIEREDINITQWKRLTLLKDGIEISIDESIYYIKGITVEFINEINTKNKSVKFSYEYIRSSLQCSFCGGTGIVDWISKAVKSKTNNQHSLSTNYIRDKKGLINVLTNDSGIELLTSVPNKAIETEYCSECLGCGLKIPPRFKKINTMYFDRC